MAIIAKEEGGGNFEQVEAGTYLARAFGVIALGTTYNQKFDKTSYRIVIQFELPTELIDAEGSEHHGMPRGLSKFYTLSLHEKSTLRADLERWRNKPFTAEELEGFDLKNVIGAGCMVSVVHNQSGKANISAISALPKGTSLLPQINPTRYFDLEDFTHFDDIPKGFQKMIKESDEYRNKFGAGEASGMAPTEAPAEVGEDEIPF